MDLFFMLKLLLLVQGAMTKSKKDSIQSRILPGNIAADAQFPYQGYLSYGGRFICGGSIIHQRWVLTAAHCILRRDYPLFTVGTNNRGGSDGINYGIESFSVHSKYRQQNGSPYIVVNDIGLIRVATDMQFDNYKVQSIPLARDTAANYDYQKAVMTGWGISQYGKSPSLLYESVSMMPIRSCKVAANGWYINEEMHICASNANRQQACPGDSGSPLVLNGEQIGVASIADRRCRGLKPSVYVKVSTYIPWIQQAMALYGEYI